MWSSLWLVAESEVSSGRKDKGFQFNPHLMSYRTFMSGRKKKGNRKNNSFNRELSPYFVLMGFQPWRFICCAATAGTQETAPGMQNWWERWQNEACCYARPAERGKDSLAESRSFLRGPAPAAHGSQVNLCEMTVFEELPLQKMRVKHQRPLFCSSAAGVELT